MVTQIELPVSAVEFRQSVFLNTIGNVAPYVHESERDPDSHYLQLIAVHTGQLVPHFEGGGPGGGVVADGQIFSFVPYADGTVQKFQSEVAHPPAEMAVNFEVAASASLGAYEDRGEHDWTISAVNGFVAHLAPLHGEAFGEHILVLRVDLAGMKTIIHRVSYQVTVKLSIFDMHGENQGKPRLDLMEWYLNANFSRFTPNPSDIPPTF